jgi:FkbM family methyltransferase
LDYPLNPDSVVVDAGAYRGDWASQIRTRYDPKLVLFEPVPEYAEALRQRFRDHSKVSIHPFGLGGYDRTARISSGGDGSSIFASQGQEQQIQVRDAFAALEEIGAPAIHLLKLNVEGAEYEILLRLHQLGFLSRVGYIQVQFHPFPDGYAQLYSECRRVLAESHQAHYEYPFVWERWKRRA